jgi:hypothetical protein
MSLNKLFFFTFLTFFSCSSTPTAIEGMHSFDEINTASSINLKEVNDVREMLNMKYFSTDNYNELTVDFIVKGDTCFVHYMNIIDNGNYLNDTDDPEDYASKFNWKELDDLSVKFPIKNYRFEETYDLVLKFYPSKKRIDWKIASDGVAYLPNQAVLSEYDN